MLPSGKEPKEYAFLKQLTNAGCAWEFGRRNQDYVKDYASLAAEDDFPKELPLSPKFEPQAVDHHPARKADESFHQWRVRAAVEGHEPHAFSKAQFVAIKWGLLEPADPAKNATQQVVQFRPLEPYPLQPYWDELSQYFEDEGRGLPRPPHVTLVFDLRYSLDEQLKRARKQLAQRRKAWEPHLDIAKKAHNASRMQLIKYLRVLDLYTEEKITAKQIASILYKKPNTVKPHTPTEHQINSIYAFHKRALHLTTKIGYESILRSRSRASKKSAT